MNSNVSWVKPEQVEAMRDAAHQGRHGHRDEAIITMLYDTGLRCAELSGVDREMLDLDVGELRIPPRIQKDYPNDNTPNPATFELDQSNDLRTPRILRSYLNTRDDDQDPLFLSQKNTRLTGRQSTMS
jgi:site-specific recombinase XerC